MKNKNIKHRIFLFEKYFYFLQLIIYNCSLLLLDSIINKTIEIDYDLKYFLK